MSIVCQNAMKEPKDLKEFSVFVQVLRVLAPKEPTSERCFDGRYLKYLTKPNSSADLLRESSHTWPSHPHDGHSRRPDCPPGRLMVKGRSVQYTAVWSGQTTGQVAKRLAPTDHFVCLATDRLSGRPSGVVGISGVF